MTEKKAGKEKSAHLDVDTSELPTRLAQPLRCRPMRRLVIFVPLRSSFVRILPRLLEQHLIIHHTPSYRIRHRCTSFNRDNGMAEGRVQLVESEEGEEGCEESEEDTGAARGRVRLQPGAEGEQLSDGEAAT